MSSTFIYLDWHPGGEGARRAVYRLGNLILCADKDLDLAPGDTGERVPLMAGATADMGDSAGGKARVYRGPGVFGGGEWPVLCHRTDTGYFVEVEGRSRFFVSADGGRLSRVKPFNENFDRELLFGPVMTLALALRGMFTLHCSAVEVDGAGVCFLGESGAGKSTTAAYFDRTVPGAVRVVDDLAPFFVAEGLHYARGYPQAGITGCPRTLQGAPVVTARILVWLARHDPVRPAGIEPLGPAELARQLVGSTMGTRMFTRRLLHQHLKFCAEAAPVVRGFRSSLPREHRSLEVLAGHVRRALD